MKFDDTMNETKKDTNARIINNFYGSIGAIYHGDVTYQAPVQHQYGQQQQHKTDVTQDKITETDDELFHFIHPSVSHEQELLIHEEIKRLVASQGIQEICSYLSQLRDQQKVLLPQNAERAYQELLRMGMPNDEGYSLKTFTKYYVR